MFFEIFFRQPKRINLKMYTSAVFDEAVLCEKRQKSVMLNKEFYEKMQKAFNVNYH